MFLCRVFLQTPHIPSINHILWVYYTTIQTLICTHTRANTHTQTKFAMGIPVEGLDRADRQRAFLPSPSLPHPFLSPQPENFHLALPTSKTWLTAHRERQNNTHTHSLKDTYACTFHSLLCTYSVSLYSTHRMCEPYSVTMGFQKSCAVKVCVFAVFHVKHGVCCSKTHFA